MTIDWMNAPEQEIEEEPIIQNSKWGFDNYHFLSMPRNMGLRRLAPLPIRPTDEQVILEPDGTFEVPADTTYVTFDLAAAERRFSSWSDIMSKYL